MSETAEIAEQAKTERQSIIDWLRRGNEACMGKDHIPEACKSVEPDPCTGPGPNTGPEAVIPFRRPLPLTRIEFRAPEPEEQDFTAASSGCFRLRSAKMSVMTALDLEFEQRWWFRAHRRAALATTVSLAPGEQLRLTIETSQRKHFEQKTLDEVEENDTTESTIVDRDVINITRSSTRSKNWTVNGGLSLSIPIKGAEVGLNFGGSVAKSFSETAQSSAEQVREATEKSSATLRSLQRVEVKESVETYEERERSRLIRNPYRDRSISLKVYALAKDFCVEFLLLRTRPMVIFEIDDILFSRAFVLANASFLEQSLQDRRLLLELQEALETATDTAYGTALEDVESLSRLALRYLFDVPNIFNVDSISGTDANPPATSFNAQLSKDGLNDATENRLGLIFTTLNYYYAIYTNEAPSNDRLYLSLALSLEAALRPLWMGVEETDQAANVLDDSDFTEIFRRLGGFLSLIAGSVRPQLHPADEDRERIEQARRAEFVIGRVVSHLQCHRHYYIGLFLRYNAAMGGGIAFRRMVEDLLGTATQPPGLAAHWAELFSTEELFVSDNQIIVPGRCAFDEEITKDVLEESDKVTDFTFGLLSRSDITAPTDGVHVEPVEGACRLTDVPDAEAPPYLRIGMLNDETLLPLEPAEDG
ncbi:hypothetical protein ACFSUD_16350 [Sulfitobacter aestuarii]|uniref:Uncharacterized protein n=1 Tax=Sulfitobacter aestuarii TaxID=2161676 RepID=A0ABW5U5P1_9RHOB